VKPTLSFVFFACAATFLAACVEGPKQAYVPAAPVPSFHAMVPPPVRQIRRVAVMPIAYETPLEASLGELDAALREELAKTSMFEIVPVSRETLETSFGHRQFSSVEVLPGDFLSKLRAQYGVDGILFTDLTHYRPYQPISIGLRSKLVEAYSGRVRWAFDHLFDAGNAATAEAAEGYYLATTPPPPTAEHPSNGPAVLQSPSRFTKYAAWEEFRSLLNTAALPN
jgi:hypothetical protein